jgi:hypothetical protein
MRLHAIVTSSAVLAALCSMLIAGCGGGTAGDEGSDPTLQGGELNGGMINEDASGKITICHVPPGNPANAHTLIVGAAAWSGHRHHKGDHLGPCEGEGAPDAGVPPSSDGGTETPPPPPPPGPDAGTPGPTCAEEGAACGVNVVCCGTLQCSSGTCQAVIN